MARATAAEVEAFMGGRAEFPCACANCGYDAGGHLVVVDRYATDYPPIPWCDLRAVENRDDPEAGQLHECPVCGGDLDYESVVERDGDDEGRDPDLRTYANTPHGDPPAA